MCLVSFSNGLRLETLGLLRKSLDVALELGIVFVVLLVVAAYLCDLRLVVLVKPAQPFAL